ncbi:MAG: 23S rRNA (pseudouridine(1915)-N(3))-methyltransferase RlmH [Rickettsiales bacterium]
MRITIAAVGRAKRGPEAELIAHYLKQIRWDVSVKEIADAPANLSPDNRKDREAKTILALLGATDLLVAMDSTGKNLTSPELATLIQKAQKNATKHIVFAIGGQDGLAPELLRRAKHTLAFGAATWPHQLLRAMLMEQLFRAYSITIGHPYHVGH